MGANRISATMSIKSNESKGVILASHAMIKVIFTVVLIASCFRFTLTQQQPERKQREEIIPKLSNHRYVENATSVDVNQLELAPIPTTTTNYHTNLDGKARASEDGRLSISTTSVSSTTNVVTSPTSSSVLAELTSPSFSQTSSMTRKQEDSKQPNNQQTSVSNSSSTRLLLHLQQRQEHQHARPQHKPTSGERDHPNGSSRQQAVQQVNQDPIYQASTSQSVTIAEPEMAASSQEQQQQKRQPQQQQPKSGAGNNRWTHFGARLRPLHSTFTTRDHNEAASKSLPAIVYNGGNMQQRSQLRQVAGSSPSLNTNQVGDSDEDDDLNDDQDSEALLYKMMQQQGFLMGSPLWQQQKPNSNVGASLSGTDADGNQLIGANGNGDGRDSLGNSKKVIKLLKSYSHIHQVDDSDDQIRGTYTRLPLRRPTVNDNGNWQPTNRGGEGQQHNRNRLPNNNRQHQHQKAQHIFVSSQPLAKAYSQQVSGQYAGDSENYPQAGNQQQGAGGGSLYAEEGGDASSQGGPAPEEDEFECPNNGIFADEASGCESYHVCQSGAQVQQKFQCPKGTLFNNIILTCDFAHNVQCNKNKDASGNLRPEDQLDPQAYQAGQPQQLPRASNQVIQNNYVQQPQQQQQARWAQQASSQAGPRHLKIGSQYNQHNQQSSPVSAYPPPKSLASNFANSDSSDDDSDDDPIVPLVPATLPPRLVSSNELAYNAPPPMPSYTAPTQKAHQHHQSAHQSQYPNFQPSGYSNQNERAVLGSYDGDSAVSPVFASHDEPARTTEASTATRSYSDHSSGAQQSSDAQSFNLVINHLTPAKQQQQQPFKSGASQLKQAVNNNYNKKPANQAKHSQLVPANLPLAAYKKNEQPRKQQYTQSPPPPAPNRQAAINPHPHSSGTNRDVLKQSARQQAQYQRPSGYDNTNSNHLAQQQARQPLATQLKAVHVDGGQPMALRAALVDLTNDHKSAGVASEALNDGLLLIVRHSSAPGQPDQSGQVSGPAEAHRSPYASGKRAGGKPSVSTASSGQAYAIDPAIVRPNSPIDAQLFPNVQRAIAATQGANGHHHYHHNNKQQHLNHQADQSARHVQHAPAPLPPMQQSAHLNRISAPLPPMDPPRPIISVANELGHHANAEPQIVAASSSHQPTSASSLAAAPSASTSSTSSITFSSASTSASPSTEPSLPAASQSKRLAAQQKAESPKQARVKRTKRLKAAQQPPTLAKSQPKVDAKPATAATNQPQKRELKPKAIDEHQPPAAAVEVDRQQARRASQSG